MRDYHKPSLRSGMIPPKPRTQDEAVSNFAKNEEAAQERNRQISRDERAKTQAEQKQNRDAAGRRAEGIQKTGPAERMVGQGLQNTPARVASLTPPDPKLTAAQQEMRAKREAARQQDRDVLAGKAAPQKVPELPTWAPSRNGDRSR